ncbi:MAG: metallophosphoesterase, partial [Treponemataceae bacterium]
PFIPFGAYEHDDFVLRGVALELPDGSRLVPDRMLSRLGSGALKVRSYDESAAIEVGDGEIAQGMPVPSRPQMVSFDFPIPPEARTAFELDLSSITHADGEVIVSLYPPAAAPLSARLFIDSKPPEIVVPFPAPGVLVRGKVRLDATARDEAGGIAGPDASLDGVPVTLPLEIEAASLPAGVHEFVVRARDRVGNEAAKRLSFYTENENPLPPGVLRSPEAQGSPAARPGIKVELRDPQGDELRLELRRGWKLGTADGSVRAYAAVYPLDPPKTRRSESEAAVEPSVLSAVDGARAEISTVSGFPGHRFELRLPDARLERARVTWTGSTLPGRQLTAWAWDYETGAWTYKVAGPSGPLSWELDLVREVRNGTANILVLDPPLPAAAEKGFTIAWLSDPQYYAASYPAVYESMTKWVAEQYRAGEIDYLIATGDMVDVAVDEKQWHNADRAMSILDEAGIPYGVASGNHDVQQEALVYDTFLHYFGDARDTRLGSRTVGGSWRGGIHSYDLVSFGSQDFLFLYLGYGLESDPDAVKWASGILATHPNRVAVICLHSYLKANGARAAKADPVFERLVRPFPNVALVLSGHIHGAARSERLVEFPGSDSRKVHELLADYQSGPMGGSGFLRLLRFDPVRSLVSVRTYSPYLDKRNFFSPEKDEFELSFSFPPPVKLVSTDSIAVEVFGSDVLAFRDGIVSGSMVELAEPTGGAWYPVALDHFGGKSSSAKIFLP